MFGIENRIARSLSQKSNSFTPDVSVTWWKVHNWEEDNPEHVSLSSEKMLEDYYSRSIIQFRVKRNDRGTRKRTSPEIRTRKRTKGDFPPPFLYHSRSLSTLMNRLECILRTRLREGIYTIHRCTTTIYITSKTKTNFLLAAFSKNHASPYPWINAKRRLGKTSSSNLSFSLRPPGIVDEDGEKWRSVKLQSRHVATGNIYLVALLVSTPGQPLINELRSS